MILYQLKNGIEEEFKISSESEQIRLSAFTYNATRMGSAPTISATLLHPVASAGTQQQRLTQKSSLRALMLPLTLSNP